MIAIMPKRVPYHFPADRPAESGAHDGIASDARTQTHFSRWLNPTNQLQKLPVTYAKKRCSTSAQISEVQKCIGRVNYLWGFRIYISFPNPVWLLIYVLYHIYSVSLLQIALEASAVSCNKLALFSNGIFPGLPGFSSNA